MPSMSDLENLADDGTFKIEEPVRTDTGRVEDLVYIYQRRVADARGEEIDLRATQEELERVGEPLDIEPASPVARPGGVSRAERAEVRPGDG